MNYNIKILESVKEISDKIINALIQDVKKVINLALPNIQNDLKTIVSESLRNEPEYSSLLSGTLRAEFGIPDASSVDRVIDALCNTIQIEQNALVAGRSGLKGGFTINMMKSEDMNGVIYLDIASVVDNERGYSLPWLEWLLYENNKPIVKKYSVNYVNSPYSRSGMAIMIPSGSSWRVPPEFAGSIRNNWTTRAINSSENRIYQSIINNIEKVL